ncbi:proton-translocating transhydrogenase family protein [Shigella flexneri]
MVTTANGVKIIGYTDLPGRLPTSSSQLYGTNLLNPLKPLCKEKDGNVVIDFDDVVIRGVTVVREGEITLPAPPIQVSAQPQAAAKKVEAPKAEANPELAAAKNARRRRWRLFCLAGRQAWRRKSSSRLYRFRALLRGRLLRRMDVPTGRLHTPLMSVTSRHFRHYRGGHRQQIGHGGLGQLPSFIALIASINIFGGFTVTQRMLKMFRKG